MEDFNDDYLFMSEIEEDLEEDLGFLEEQDDPCAPFPGEFADDDFELIKRLMDESKKIQER